MGSPEDPLRLFFDRRSLEIEEAYAKDIKRAERTAQRAADEADPRRKANLERESERIRADAAADRDFAREHITHVPGRLDDYEPEADYALKARRQEAGFPAEGLGQSEMAKRWGIEIYHRILKSGCNIEDRQLGTADRLEACLAIDLVVAWRVMHLVHLNREVPNLPATVYFEDMQWQALLVYASKSPKPPADPPTLYEAVRLLGRMGGHLARKLDAEPGAEALWTGLQRLDDLTEMYRIMANPPTPPPRSSG
jgi:hypothetical protein